MPRPIIARTFWPSVSAACSNRLAADSASPVWSAVSPRRVRLSERAALSPGAKPPPGVSATSGASGTPPQLVSASASATTGKIAARRAR
ncbi:MAG TPA: hypothetical protein VFY87_25795 [Geminicoccaceae bacterium]|nr:hypothetical protein [Geminicoccaceae bacterium]